LNEIREIIRDSDDEAEARTEILAKIIRKVEGFHQQCGVAVGSISIENIYIDREDGEMYFFEFQI
jgi:hypothetical protein